MKERRENIPTFENSTRSLISIVVKARWSSSEVICKPNDQNNPKLMLIGISVGKAHQKTMTLIDTNPNSNI